MWSRTHLISSNWNLKASDYIMSFDEKNSAIMDTTVSSFRNPKVLNNTTIIFLL